MAYIPGMPGSLQQGKAALTDAQIAQATQAAAATAQTQAPIVAAAPAPTVSSPAPAFDASKLPGSVQTAIQAAPAPVQSTPAPSSAPTEATASKQGMPTDVQKAASAAAAVSAGTGPAKESSEDWLKNVYVPGEVKESMTKAGTVGNLNPEKKDAYNKSAVAVAGKDAKPYYGPDIFAPTDEEAKAAADKLLGKEQPAGGAGTAPAEEKPPEEKPPAEQAAEPNPMDELIKKLFERTIGLQDTTLATATKQAEEDRKSASGSMNDAKKAQDLARDLAATYGQAFADSVGSNAAEYARLADTYAQGAANPEADAATKAAVRQAIAAARASGINRGQAAIVGGQQAGNLFTQAYQDAVNRATGRYKEGAEFLRLASDEQARRRESAAKERQTALDLRDRAGQGLTSTQAELSRQAGNLATLQLTDARDQEKLKAASDAAGWASLGDLGRGIVELIPGFGDWLGGLLFPEEK